VGIRQIKKLLSIDSVISINRITGSFLFTAIFLVAPAFVFGQASFDEKNTTVSNIRLNVTNVGTLGSAFRGELASCEYPKNSGIEHLFEGGLWVGALINGSLTAVSTAAYDASSGYSTGKRGFEFTAPVGSKLLERSSLFDSPFYSQDAISHQDYVSDFTDANTSVPGTSITINDHLNPMNISVHMESYNWNYAFSDFFVILNYKITNNGPDRLDSVFIGLWDNAVIRNINITPAGQGGSNFFNKGGNGFVDTLSLAYEFDAAGDLGYTESYFATKFLGADDKTGFNHPRVNNSFLCNYQSWMFNNSSDPTFFFPTDELGRYNKMTQGLNHLPCWAQNSSTNSACGLNSIQQLLKQQGNRSEMVSVGPFASLNPGESINIAFAVVCAKKKEDGNPNTVDNLEQKENLFANAAWAQTAYNGEDSNFNGNLDAGEDKDGNGKITRFILPTPPDIPKTKVVAADHKIDIYFASNSERSEDPISKKKDFEGYKIYLSTLGFDVNAGTDINESLKLVAQFDKKGNSLFFNTGFDSIRLAAPVYFEGDTVAYTNKYSIPNIVNGWQYAVAVTSFDEGNKESNLESLESSRIANLYRVFPGKTANSDMKANEPFVYPNPYYAGAAWEGSSKFQEDKKLMFSNLPAHCLVRIYSVAGDVIDEFEHTSNYDPKDTRWYQTYSDTENTVFPGGEHAWDILSLNSQIISRGLYMFSVKDLDTGKLYQGKFAIIK
jgi:hypothetical protein